MKLKIRQEIKEICAHENVVALLFLILMKKNIEQRQMMSKDNGQEQKWWHETIDRMTEEQDETRRWVLTDRKWFDFFV